MKKSVMAAAVALALGTGAAQATNITMTNMAFYNKSGSFSGNYTATGSIDSTTATGSFTGTFFGTGWTASVQTAFNGTGAHVWKGTSPQGAYSYSWNQTAGEVGFGLYFDWSTNSGIPVLAVFNCGSGAPGSTCSAVDTDGDGVPGTAMQTAPFPGQTPAFSGTVAGVSAVPVPAAVWLFGSGLIGLVGVGRRKKSA